MTATTGNGFETIGRVTAANREYQVAINHARPGTACVAWILHDGTEAARVIGFVRGEPALAGKTTPAPWPDEHDTAVLEAVIRIWDNQGLPIRKASGT